MEKPVGNFLHFYPSFRLQLYKYSSNPVNTIHVKLFEAVN